MFKVLNLRRSEKKKNIFRERFPDIYIHPDSYISDFVKIGFGTRIDGPAYIKAHQEATINIGKYCAIAHNLRIRSANHATGYPNVQNSFQISHGFNINKEFRGQIKVGHNSWIADNVIILPGVNIGNGVCIGAGSIITKDIPAYAVAVGSPARVIRYRFDKKIIEQLSEIEWWNWCSEKIKRNRLFFETDLSLDSALNLSSLITDE